MSSSASLGPPLVRGVHIAPFRHDHSIALITSPAGKLTAATSGTGGDDQLTAHIPDAFCARQRPLAYIPHHL